MLEAIAYADILKISDADLEFLAPDHSGDYATELAAIGFSGRLAAVTLGADGTWYKAGARTGQVPSPHVVVVETTGSGDAFTACLLDSLIPRRFDLDSISDDELRGIMRRACAAGALTATGYGAIPSLPDAKEIDALLRMMGNNVQPVG